MEDALVSGVWLLQKFLQLFIRLNGNNIYKRENRAHFLPVELVLYHLSGVL